MKTSSRRWHSVIGVILCMCCRLSTELFLPSPVENKQPLTTMGPGKPRISSVTMNAEKNISAIEGDDIDMRCEFIAVDTVVAQWIKFTKLQRGIVTFTKTTDKENLHVSLYNISNVSKEDAGKYDCLAANGFGMVSTGFHLTVFERTCNNSDCGENGKCAIVNNVDVQCQCNEGYAGLSCQSVDHCLSVPCDNDGECETTENGFICRCSEEFKGKTCQTEKCLPHSCMDRGNCIETENGKKKCQCSSTFAGNRCQYVCRGFRNIYCHYSYGKTCVIDEENYSRSNSESCTCERGRQYGSNKCMLKKDLQNECTKADICNGHGNCVDFMFGYTCQCYSHYSGKNCEKYNECSAYASSRCSSSGAPCIDLNDGFKCSCPSNQYGTFCQYSRKPCKVTCFKKRMDFSCDMKFLSPTLQYLSLETNGGTCSFSTSSRTTGGIAYDSCGTTTEYGNNSVVFRNSVSVGKLDPAAEDSDLIIHQAGYFKFDMMCKQELNATNRDASFSVKRIPKNESRIVQDLGVIGFETIISYYNSLWNQQAHYIVGERIFVKVQLEGRYDIESYLQPAVLLPKTCIATPNRTSGYPSFTLLQDGCIKDESLRFEDPPTDVNQYSKPKLYFSFETFGFKNAADAVYLKCTVNLCVNKTTSAADTADKCQRKCSEEVTISRIKRYAEDDDDDEMAVIETTLRRSIEFQ